MVHILPQSYVYGVTKALKDSENCNEVAFLSEMLLVDTSHIRERLVGVVTVVVKSTFRKEMLQEKTDKFQSTM